MPSTVHLLVFDYGDCEGHVRAAFSTPEKLAAFVKRYEPDNHATQEFVVDEFDDADWPPGRSYLIIVRPKPPPSGVYYPIKVSDCISLYSKCTREWRVEQRDDSYRTEFWGTREEAKAFAEAKLVEERNRP
jgi:hypothetical protein